MITKRIANKYNGIKIKNVSKSIGSWLLIETENFNAVHAQFCYWVFSLNGKTLFDSETPNISNDNVFSALEGKTIKSIEFYLDEDSIEIIINTYEGVQVQICDLDGCSGIIANIDIGNSEYVTIHSDLGIFIGREESL